MVVAEAAFLVDPRGTALRPVVIGRIPETPGTVRHIMDGAIALRLRIVSSGELQYFRVRKYPIPMLAQPAITAEGR